MELTATKYKQTEVGLIPEDWDVKTLGDVGEVKMCKRIFSYQTKEKGDIPFFKIGTFGKKPDAFISRELYDEFKRKYSYPTKGTILISAAGTIGKLVVYDGTDAYFQDSNIIWIENNNKVISNEYLKHSFPIVKFQTEGGTIQRLYNNILKSGLFPSPATEPEQKAIAKVLSDTDALIQALEKKIAKKKLVKKGTSQQLLFGKNRLKGFETDRKSKKTVFGDIPDDWDVKPLPDVFNYIHGKAHEQFIVDNGSFEVVNSKFVSSEGTIVKYSSDNFCPAKKGDILTVLSDLPNGKALAKTFFVEYDNRFAVNQRICIWRSKSDDPLFMYYFMNRHKYFLKFDDGVTQTHILNHHINECPVLVPRNKNEQIAIGKALHTMDEEIKILEQKLAKYQLAKQGMMQQLLTGKIRLV